MFIVCGEALIDIFIENQNHASAYQFPLQACVGGSPFNVAIGLARLQQPVSLLTALSNDMFGKRLSAVLEVEGVSQDLIIQKQLPTTVAFIEKGKNGIPTYSFLGEGAADRSILKDEINIKSKTPIGIHLGSYCIVAQPTADSFFSLVKEYSSKCLISLNPNIRAIVEPDMEVWRTRVDELVEHTDILKVSDENLGLMYPDLQPEVLMKNG